MHFREDLFSSKSASFKITSNTLIRETRGQMVGNNQPVDLADWFNWVAFDIAADLSFGEPFETLSDNEDRP